MYQVSVSEKHILNCFRIFCQVPPWLPIHVFIEIHLAEMILTVEGPKMVIEPVPKSKMKNRSLRTCVIITSSKFICVCGVVFIQKHVLWKDILYRRE